MVPITELCMILISNESINVTQVRYGLYDFHNELFLTSVKKKQRYLTQSYYENPIQTDNSPTNWQKTENSPTNSLSEMGHY